MMRNKYACITGFMGLLHDRFATYGVERDFEQMVQVSSTVKGCSGLEVVYPQQIQDPVKGKAILDKYGMGVAALNINVKGEPTIKLFKEMYADMGQRSYENRLRIGQSMMSRCPYSLNIPALLKKNYLDFKQLINGEINIKD